MPPQGVALKVVESVELGIRVEPVLCLASRGVGARLFRMDEF